MGIVADDADIAEGGKVGSQADVQRIEVVVVLLAKAFDGAHHQSGGEDGGIAAGNYRVALGELHVAGQFLERGEAYIPAVPCQCPEEARTEELAAQARLRVEERDDDRVVIRDGGDDADYPPVGDYAHVLGHAVKRAPVEGDVVGKAADAVAHHLGRDEAVWESGEVCGVGDIAVEGSGVGGEYLELVLEAQDLHLEGAVAFGQFVVQLAEVEVSHHRPREGRQMAGNDVGRAEHHVALVSIVPIDEREGDHLQEEEEEPVALTNDEIEQLTHIYPSADTEQSGAPYGANHPEPYTLFAIMPPL